MIPILGPLLFLLFINDIVKDKGCNIRLFADNTSLFLAVENPDTAAEILNSSIGPSLVSMTSQKWRPNGRHGSKMAAMASIWPPRLQDGRHDLRRPGDALRV